MTHSFYAIDLPNPLPNPPSLKSLPVRKDLNRQPLSPIFEFRVGEYPTDMCCVKFASKFYFLGGELLTDVDDMDPAIRDKFKGVKRNAFPRDVYIFDPASVGSSSVVKAGIPMTSGKACPHSFVFNGKMYVLGSSLDSGIIMDPETRERSLELKKSMNYFEAFDFSINRWVVLEPPPPSKFRTEWYRCIVVNRCVFVYGFELPGEHYVRVVFDLDRQVWRALSRIHKFPLCAETLFARTVWAEIVGNTVYVLDGRGIAKLSNFTDDEDGHIESVSMDRGMAIFTRNPGLECSKSICHLGDRRFCYAVAGSPPLPRALFVDEVDECTRYLRISILEELQETCTRADSFKAKILYTANYVIENEFFNIGDFCDCYVLRPEEKKKKKKRKRNKNKNKINTNRNGDQH